MLAVALAGLLAAGWINGPCDKGCKDKSTAPAASPASQGSFSSVYFSVSVTLTRFDGDCFFYAPGGGNVGSCEEDYPCTPYVEISLYANGSGVAPVLNFNWTGGGTHGALSGSSSSAGSATAFSDYTAVSCGSSEAFFEYFNVSAQWDINGNGVPVTVTFYTEISGSLLCSSCLSAGGGGL